jgi:hypothetical protein
MIMKTNIEEGKNKQNFNDQSNFGVRCIASCRKLLRQIENVKTGIVDEFRGRLEDHQHVLELAVNEAEALAWQAGFPQLLFPTLAVEKARAVETWHSRQESLRRRTSPMLIAA